MEDQNKQQFNQSKELPKSQSDYNFCPTCKRPYSFDLSITHKKNRFLGLPLWICAIGLVTFLVIILIFSCFIVNSFLFEPQKYTESYSMDVIIAQGGHFKYHLGYMQEEMEISVDIYSTEDVKFDLYIMDLEQYENSYGSGYNSNTAFSAIYSKENISRINETCDLSVKSQGYRELYLIIDNRDFPLTPEDAVPTGTITIDLNLDITSVYYFD